MRKKFIERLVLFLSDEAIEMNRRGHYLDRDIVRWVRDYINEKYLLVK